MKKIKKSYILPLLLAAILLFLYNAVFSAEQTDVGTDFDYPVQTEYDFPSEKLLDEDGYYYSAEDVADYIHMFKHLPDNFITKKEAEKLGWNGGSLKNIDDSLRIGGDYFGNYEGRLPKGKDYTECDVNCPANSRGGERIIFSDDGWIYYTPDHYETFETLYIGD